MMEGAFYQQKKSSPTALAVVVLIACLTGTTPAAVAMRVGQ